MQGFADYARYLQQPLTLIGFVLLLFFGVHRALLRSGILPPVTARSGSRIVQSLLRYGFIIGLATIVLGFGLEFFKTYHKAVTPEQLLRATAPLTDAYDRSTHQRELHNSYEVSDKERQEAASSTREIEDLMSKAGIKLSPQQLTGLGYLYLVTNEPEKAKIALLDAIKGDPSMGEPNALLAVITQLQANELLQKGDLNLARETLSMAEHYAKEAQWAFPEDSSIGNQLGFIYKDIAQQEFDRHDQASALTDLKKAKEIFQQRLNIPNDPSAHNGLGSVYYLEGNFDKAIEEQHEALKIYPRYTFAWHDLAIALAEKYDRDKPPNTATLFQLNDALDKIFDLQQTAAAEKLPPAHLARIEEMRASVRAEIAKLPKAASSQDAARHFNVSGVGSRGQTTAIEAALVQYYWYLRSAGIPVPGGTVQVQITPASSQYLSYYDPSKETIFLNVQYADSTFWPLRDYTFRALGLDPSIYQRPALVAILSGLATYYPSSSRNNPNYGPAYGGHLDQFRSLGELRPELQNASSDGSSIWGSICWELRTLLDRDAADVLLLQAWRQMNSTDPAQPDAVRFASKIIEVHKSSGGTKTEAIRQMFEKRGLQL